jgi:hypothetical protein
MRLWMNQIPLGDRDSPNNWSVAGNHHPSYTVTVLVMFFGKSERSLIKMSLYRFYGYRQVRGLRNGLILKSILNQV